MRSSLIIIAAAAVLLLFTFLVSILFTFPWQQNFIVIAIFMVILTIATHQINLQATKQEGRAVITPYLISTVLKLVLSGGFLFILIKFNPEIVRSLVFGFLVYYTVFTALEIFLVSKRLRSKKF